ncbi:MAG: tetratricopeptide repeat protein [Rhodospirillaceae bacterium]|nr:MAG: tetratricopeptide repeat protein [Rhodospirillaceae bacterium]
MAVKSADRGDEITRLLQRAADRHRAGDLDGAEKDYRRVLKYRPRNADALNLSGLIAEQRGNHTEAARLIDQALSIHDDFIDAHFNRARIAHRSGDLQIAEHHLRRGLQLRPAAFSERLNLATVLVDQRRNGDAIVWLRETVAQYPQFTEAYVRLGRMCRVANDSDGMLAAATAGLKQNPLDPILHLLASEAHFDRGELKEGWRAYRWRFKSTENQVVDKAYPLPVWQGENLANRCILVWTEQAPGDEILYANMLSDLVAQAKRCAIQCSPRLAPLFRRSFPAAQIFDRDLTAAEIAAFDVQTSAASAGEWLRSDFAAFPHHTGYLVADQARRALLRARYETPGQKHCIVGIAWRSSGVENATDKSVSLLDWGPILRVPGVTFVNLQYGDCMQELTAAAKGFGARIIHDPEINPLKDMDGFAAQVAAMDLVISSSNTAAHVAGALGVPVFCMLPLSFATGRRWWWFPTQSTCPWYPSLRRFFQRQAGQWFDVLRDAGLALLDFAVARGVVQKPAPYLRSMGKGFAELGRYDDAEHIYRRLSQEPGLAAEALSAIAKLRKTAGALEEALHLYDEAIAVDPSFWHAYNGKGMILANQMRFDEAISVYKMALTHAPQSPELHNNLGNAYRRYGDGENALTHFREAHRLKPEHKSIHLNLASTLDELGRADEALESFDTLVDRAPDYVDALYNRAQALLSAGRFVEGWSEFPWRLKRSAANVRYDAFPQPVWQGEDLAGRNILVWTEQGIGDEIMTASMLSDAIEKARHVTFVCSERLLPLMRRSFPKATVVERKEPLPAAAVDPAINLQMSQSELGLALRRDWTDFPRQERFLKADPTRQSALRRKYQSLRPGARLVGISWRSSNHEVGWLKGQDLLAWAPILSVAGNIAFVNLQYGDCREDLARVRQTLGIDILHDPDIDPLKDMDGFAAQVGAMDLVISTSNTTVHTAGALGIPTWVLLPAGRGRMWYWFRERADSLWYPSLRLMRQVRDGDWKPLFDLCAERLAEWLSEH